MKLYNNFTIIFMDYGSGAMKGLFGGVGCTIILVEEGGWGGGGVGWGYGLLNKLLTRT